MKRRRAVSPQSFALRYEDRLPDLRGVATAAREAVREALRPANLELHQVDARAKALSSAVAKVRRKQYGRPWQQLTDQVGVRVIVYYAEDVDRAAAAIRGTFEIDEGRSVDKRRDLQLRQFGYRSVHLLIRLGKQLPPQLERFGRMWIEVQIRSLLEHGWAEIEHEICYKAGVHFPDSLLRRFGALAGTLEILDLQFSGLREEREALIDSLVKGYLDGNQLDDKLDAARLVALLEAQRPRAPGWREKGAIGRRFAPNSDAACVEALRAAGVGTGRALLTTLKQAPCKRSVAAFAAQNGIEPEAVSHFALAVLVCASAKREVLKNYPDLLLDGALRRALAL